MNPRPCTVRVLDFRLKGVGLRALGLQNSYAPLDDAEAQDQIALPRSHNAIIA